MSFRNFDNGLTLGPTGPPDSVGGDGNEELLLDLSCSFPFMRTLVRRGIKSRRIGSLQSWNGPYTTECVVDAVMVDDGPLRFRETSRRTFCGSGRFSRYHTLGAPRMDS